MSTNLYLTSKQYLIPQKVENSPLLIKQTQDMIYFFWQDYG